MERLTSFAGLVGGWHAGDNLERIRRTGNPYTTWTGRPFLSSPRLFVGTIEGDRVPAGTPEWPEFPESIRSEFSEPAMTAYDISARNYAATLDSAMSLPPDASLLVHDGFIRAALPLVEARRALLKIRKLGGVAYLVPVEYRSPAISMFSAKEIALQVHARMLAAGEDLEDIDEGRNDLLWWTFRANDREAISPDVIPGCVSISVDKLDGHIRTDEEYRAWLELNKVT